MAVHITGQEKSGRYSYEQWIVTDPAEPVVRIHTTVHWNQPGLRMYVLFKPAISNTGAQNLATASDGRSVRDQADRRARLAGHGSSDFVDSVSASSARAMSDSPTAGRIFRRISCSLRLLRPQDRATSR